MFHYAFLLLCEYSCEPHKSNKFIFIKDRKPTCGSAINFYFRSMPDRVPRVAIERGQAAVKLNVRNWPMMNLQHFAKADLEPADLL